MAEVAEIGHGDNVVVWIDSGIPVEPARLTYQRQSILPENSRLIIVGRGEHGDIKSDDITQAVTFRALGILHDLARTNPKSIRLVVGGPGHGKGPDRRYEFPEIADLTKKITDPEVEILCLSDADQNG